MYSSIFNQHDTTTSRCIIYESKKLSGQSINLRGLFNGQKKGRLSIYEEEETLLSKKCLYIKYTFFLFYTNINIHITTDFSL